MTVTKQLVRISSQTSQASRRSRDCPESPSPVRLRALALLNCPLPVSGKSGQDHYSRSVFITIALLHGQIPERALPILRRFHEAQSSCTLCSTVCAPLRIADSHLLGASQSHYHELCNRHTDILAMTVFLHWWELPQLMQIVCGHAACDYSWKCLLSCA